MNKYLCGYIGHFPFKGIKNGKSLLIEDGALPWIVKNANNEASTIRRHIELALCHMAQHGMFSFCLGVS